LLQRLITLWHMRKLVIFSCCWFVGRHKVIWESQFQLQRRVTSGKKICLLHISLSSQLSGYRGTTWYTHLYDAHLSQSPFAYGHTTLNIPDFWWATGVGATECSSRSEELLLQLFAKYFCL